MTTAPNTTPNRLWSVFFQGLHHAKQSFSTSSSQIHDLTGLQCGLDFIFEPLDGGSRGCITAQKRSVKTGDILILNNGGITHRYRIEQIDYYSSPSDLWTAYLSLLVD